MLFLLKVIKAVFNAVKNVVGKGIPDAVKKNLKGAKRRVAVYHTAKDEKVCSRCSPLEGYIFYFEPDGSLKPGDEKKWPPLHPRCRCPGRLEYKYI